MIHFMKKPVHDGGDAVRPWRTVSGPMSLDSWLAKRFGPPQRSQPLFAQARVSASPRETSPVRSPVVSAQPSRQEQAMNSVLFSALPSALT